MRLNLRILACRVLEDEIAALAPEADLILLDQGLHIEPAQLRTALQEQIDRADAEPDLAAIVLAYGRCGNGTTGLRAGRWPLVIPRAHDCIAVLLGSSVRQHDLQRAHPGIYWYSPGWNRYGNPPCAARLAQARARYTTAYGTDNADFLLAELEAWSQHCNHAGFIACPACDCRQAEADTQRYATELGWTWSTIPGDPSWLQDLLHGDWDCTRFLVVPPGQMIAAANDDSVLESA